jgi:hypothetical protein
MSSGRGAPQISILDARLAEIDRRLSNIQSGLDDEELQHPPRQRPDGPPFPPPETPDRERIARLERLAREQEEVLSKLNDLVRVFERLSIPAATQAAGATSSAGPVSVSAGPFTSTAALHAFEQQLRSLPGVRAVEVRGFEGADRAVLEVHLS